MGKELARSWCPGMPCVAVGAGLCGLCQARLSVRQVAGQVGVPWEPVLGLVWGSVLVVWLTVLVWACGPFVSLLPAVRSPQADDLPWWVTVDRVFHSVAAVASLSTTPPSGA